MNLIEESFQTKEEKKKKRVTKIILIAIIIVFLIMVGIVSYLLYIQSTTLKLTLDGQSNEKLKQLLVFENDGTIYVPIKEVASYLGYESYKSYFFDKENSNIPCTVRGVLQILQCNNINVKGETVLVIGKGKTSGLPLSLMLQRLGATVINVNSNTTKENLHMLLNVANIVVSCAGTPILNYENMKHSTYKAVINVGMTTIDGKVVGDIDVNDLIEHKMDYESLITPILGGTGILTVVNLLLNTCIQHYFTVKHEYLKERLFIIIGKYL